MDPNYVCIVIGSLRKILKPHMLKMGLDWQFGICCCISIGTCHYNLPWLGLGESN